MPPDEAAALISPIPLLIVHGEQDLYFPVEHGHRLYEAAQEPKELWIEPGFGHAESGADGRCWTGSRLGPRADASHAGCPRCRGRRNAVTTCLDLGRGVAAEPARGQAVDPVDPGAQQVPGQRFRGPLCLGHVLPGRGDVQVAEAGAAERRAGRLGHRHRQLGQQRAAGAYRAPRYHPRTPPTGNRPRPPPGRPGCLDGGGWTRSRALAERARRQIAGEGRIRGRGSPSRCSRTCRRPGSSPARWTRSPRQHTEIWPDGSSRYSAPAGRSPATVPAQNGPPGQMPRR